KLLPARRRSVHQSHHAIVFAVTIEFAICGGQRASAKGPLLGPDHVAAFEFLADPALAFGVTVQVFADKHHAALLIDHGLVGIDFFGFEFLPRARELNQVTAGTVASADVDKAIVKDWRGDNDVAVRGLLEIA